MSQGQRTQFSSGLRRSKSLGVSSKCEEKSLCFHLYLHHNSIHSTCGPEYCGKETGRQESAELKAGNMGAISEGARGPLNIRSWCKLKAKPKCLLWLCLEWACGGATFSRGSGSSKVRCTSLRPFPSRFLGVVDLSPGESHRGRQVFLSEMNSLPLGTMKCGGTRPRGQEAVARKVVRSNFAEVLPWLSLVGSGIFLKKAGTSVLLA